MLKKIFFQFHWFLGITAGLILSLMGVTGAIYSYEQQILRWMNQDSYTVQVPNPANKLSPSQLYQHFQSNQPDIKINSITIAHEATTSSTVNIVKEGARRGYNMMVNPYTAEVLPAIKGQEFFAFIQQLHRNLTVGPVGKQLTGACTLILIFFVLSGIYLRWPKKHSLRQWLAIKPQLKGRNFIWDLHAVVGTWVIIFYLIFAMTGLYWSYGWWRSGMFAVLGVDNPQAQQHNAPNPQGREGNGNRENKGPKEDKITPEQISYALDATWAGFNSQINRGYSSLTLNLPKNNTGEIELVFVDSTPQHERARNNATFDYNSNKITEMQLYEDKKLNEKIMSSMLPVHRGSFMGPVYQFVAMLASLAMPLFFVTGWMLYLKRRKQKKLTQLARSGAAMLNDAQAPKWHIFFATQTGTAEQIAYNTATSLQQAGINAEVQALQHVTAEQLQHIQHALFIVSTYGTGDAPDLATTFAKKQMAKNIDLSQLNYAVLALGSKEYAETYCVFGHQLEQWLAQQQAQKMMPLVEVDNGNQAEIDFWFNQLGTVTGNSLETIISEKTFETYTLTTRELLNPNSLGESAYDIRLTPTQNITWQAGDIAEIQPGNSQQRIQHFLAQHHLEATDEIIQHIRFKDLSKEIDIHLSEQHWITQLSDLPTREYSIASIPSEGYLQLVVRQAVENGELGLGSGWLTAHTALNETICASIRSNPSFHAITDSRPIICIGNGTGIAGLLSLLKQREALNLHENWLIFGEREQSKDFFYQHQLQKWFLQGHLQHLDLAFSRDQEQRLYVQHKLLEHAERVKAWIEQGAVIYVCGSINGMAASVHDALIDILGEDCVEKLSLEGRYRRDVY